MALFDMPLDALKKYNPAEKAPRDFDAFWKSTLAESAQFPLEPHFVQVTDPIYKIVDVYDVTFRGFMGQPIKGWFIEPAGNEEPLPCFVQYIGYGGGRSLPVDHFYAAAAGFALLVMDIRGQGSGWAPGDTSDWGEMPPSVSGVMTRGIDSPETYYYRRVFTDAARAVDVALAHPHVDPKRVAVTGISQGGGITLAAAGLSGNKVKLCMADVPYLCNYRRAITINDSMPYNEISRYLQAHRTKVQTVYNTLAYFDGIHFAPRIKARSLLSTGLMDVICPPSTVFAAYNRIKAPKEIAIYDFNSHEGGGPFQVTKRLQFAHKYL